MIKSTIRKEMKKNFIPIASAIRPTNQSRNNFLDASTFISDASHLQKRSESVLLGSPVSQLMQSLIYELDQEKERGPPETLKVYPLP